MNTITIKQNIYYTHSAKQRRKRRMLYIFDNLIRFLMTCFIAVAIMQSIQINRLITDTQALSTGIDEVQLQREFIHNQIADREKIVPLSLIHKH